MLATPELILEAAQSQRLAELLPRWLREVPLYRGAAVPGNELTTLQQLPLITKQDIRSQFPHNFLSSGTDLETLLEQEAIELEHTSGTSEERTPLLLPRGWWAQQEARALRLNSVVAGVLDETPQPRRVTIASPVCSGEICYTGVPSRDDRIIGESLFVSLSRYPFLWSESDLARIAAETLAWQPQFLDVDPVYGVTFARYCERHGLRFPSLKFILCGYEFVSIVHRRILERVFRVPVFNLYGSTETGHLLMEDEGGQMRPSLETAYLELLPLDAGCKLKVESRRLAPGGTESTDHSFQLSTFNLQPGPVAELVVTTLTNDFMPLIRYRIGDLVERFELPYGTRYRVHGRKLDAFVTAGGRLVTTWQIDQCLAEVAGLAHYQLLQRPGKEWQFRFVPDDPGPDTGVLSQIQQKLTDLLGLTTGLAIQPTDMLMPESSGKFRLGYPAQEDLLAQRLQAQSLCGPNPRI
jgi:phenylacetate-CoA ligase